jgi:hypothetical protein
MVRTKFTGRKCTGEDAPRKQIASVSGSTWAPSAAPRKKWPRRVGSSKVKATVTPPVPQSPKSSAVELSAEPSTAAIVSFPPLTFATHNYNDAGSSSVRSAKMEEL